MMVSTADTKEFIENFSDKYQIEFKYVWHEDIGYAKAIIVNKAISQAMGNYIIQIDGDVILHKNFIEDHIRSANENIFLRGSRVMMSQEKSERVLKNRNVRLNIFSKGFQNTQNGIYLPCISRFFWDSNTNPTDVKGCNMSFWKEDFIKINGYNEDFIGWGREDSELAFRFHNSGIRKRVIKFQAIQYHIFHLPFSRESVDSNEKELKKTIEKKYTYCTNGLKKIK